VSNVPDPLPTGPHDGAHANGAAPKRHHTRVARPNTERLPFIAATTNPDLFNPELFINRELSWLAFNRRVLEEAQDPSQPLLERVRFLGIVASNLDEFFEVRVAGIKQQIEHESDDAGPDGITARQTFDAIRQDVLILIKDQYHLWNEELLPELAKHGVHMHEFHGLSKTDQEWASDYFRKEVFPVLTPLAVDASHPFPQLQNKSHNLFLSLQRPERPTELLHAVVQIPRVLQRLVRIPHPNPHEWHYILIQNLIESHVHDLFPGLKVEEVYGFRLTRNSDLYIDEEEAENLLRTIEDELRKRSRGNAVRLEVERGCPTEMRRALLDIFRLGEDDLYEVNGPLNFLHLMPLSSIPELAALRDKPYVPIVSTWLPPGCDYFEILRQRDVMLHHPYESFSSIVDFLEQAAADPAVLAIKMTLYRTSGDSPIVHSLIRAAGEGKQVTVLVELRARFDEANNINWARQLEEAGVHVVYGLVGLKTHCKVLMIVRRDEDQLRHYLHLGTGNYHPSTARFYTDLSVLTANQELGEEVAVLFNTLTGLSEFKGVKQLIVAPFQMRSRAPGPGGSHHREAQFAGGGVADRGALRGLPGRGEDRPDHPRHLLPAARRARRKRQHPGDQHRRAVPGTQPYLLFRAQRKAQGLPRQRGLDAAQFVPACGGRFPGARFRTAQADHRHHPAGLPQRHREGPGTRLRRSLPAGQTSPRPGAGPGAADFPQPGAKGRLTPGGESRARRGVGRQLERSGRDQPSGTNFLPVLTMERAKGFRRASNSGDGS
jgi:polyphosphate kinase